MFNKNINPVFLNIKIYQVNNAMIFSSWRPQYNIGVEGDKAVVGTGHSDHFKIVPGLCKQMGTVSIESVVKPGHFLVPRNDKKFYAMHLRPFVNKSRFKNRACFKPLLDHFIKVAWLYQLIYYFFALFQIKFHDFLLVIILPNTKMFLRNVFNSPI